MAGSLLLMDKVRLRSHRPSDYCAFSSYPKSLKSFSCPQPHLESIFTKKLHLKRIIFSGQSICCYRLKPLYACSSEDAQPINQLPQIVLNTRNLLAGNKSALLAVPWLGMFTGLLGNLSLLSYFIKRGENEAVVVQTLGVISMYVVILQLAMAEAMPLPQFIATSIVIASGLILNCMKYFHLLNPEIWHLWEEFLTIAGFSALPQVMWSTFVPYIPNTVFPGLIAFVTAVLAVLTARMGKHSEKGIKILGILSGWTATLLFMWMPVAQLVVFLLLLKCICTFPGDCEKLLLTKINLSFVSQWTNLLNPEYIKGLSAVTMLLAMVGNGLLIPRALFIRDLMWFTGSTWACVFYGWGNLVCLYWFTLV
ncbi:UNVERIFIED_CONTAM: Maltose excess protein 1-like, chloroplastic [Sesamum radiatum]|uniref:Maltose excess protein 1-like, chloroplastic n=1 Tax=Sesamum radiatum TaxID=300843 RepID=A0AAW2M5D1_SESRA